MTHGAIFLLCLLGFALLMLSMQQHQRGWLGRTLSSPTGRMMRASGFVTLVLALGIAALGLDWGYGIVTWFGWQTAAAGLLVGVSATRTHNNGRTKR